MRWCSVNNNGLVVMAGDCPKGTPAESLEHIEGTVLLDVSPNVVPGAYYLDNGEMKPTPPKPTQYHRWEFGQWVLPIEVAERLAKMQRSKLLSASDWTQLPDVPLVKKEAWAEYRQALRDITNQSGYPFDIIWPIKPPI